MSEKLKVEKIVTDHAIENETDLRFALLHHGAMARLGGLSAEPRDPIEITIESVRTSNSGKPVVTISTKSDRGSESDE